MMPGVLLTTLLAAVLQAEHMPGEFTLTELNAR